ncbi:S8 family serine peptidase [Thermoactinospora rubra]|uniref:S8 family serine peptidase n=1 Tax=Thermoactinospora rubra TaxID=1088767 RepID=UPI00117BEC48|nr:S8 family serine peptidase [Thermoactinospora rubra]
MTSRLLALLTASAVAAGLMAAVPPPAGAEPTPSPAEPPADAPTVTLVTGDRVRAVARGDRWDAKPVPAPRPDGKAPTFSTKRTPRGLYVFPDDAAAAIQAGVLDPELFNVTYLIDNGYADNRAPRLPVIAEYPKNQPALRSAADALPASAVTHAIDGLGVAALEVTKSEAPAFWSAVRGGFAAPPGAWGDGPSGARAPNKKLAAGLAKLWLDVRVKTTLEESVPLVGAPAAWAAGRDGSGVKVAVLDTGADLNHPDLKGQIAETKSFIGSEDVQDKHGHGTHVATTIAGTGAAGGGKRKGVAPGARLLVGKVLDNTGSGTASQVLAGMDWAARSGARIVSMSLGAGVTGGTDVLSRKVNELTAETGALFVVAAGNLGSAEQTIATPGTADAALTVAATDKSDKLASFSSRGPRWGDLALKPDIAAPGVHIAAGRAEGTSLCEGACVQPGDGPLDAHYTASSGTSMATPHVAGAAAIVAQRHPDWTAGQLKAALMSTAKDAGFTAYEQGAGRLDVARADAQQVVATTANVDFGVVPDEHAPVTKQITYANFGTAPVTLSLTQTVGDGLSVDASVTVPAGGTATASATVDPAKAPRGVHSGAVVATDGGDIRVTTPVGLVRQPEKVLLTIRTQWRDGEPAVASAVDVVDVAGDAGDLTDHVREVDTGVYQVSVPRGTYHVAAMLFGIDERLRENLGFMVDPEVTVDGPAEVVLDATRMKKVTFTADRPVEASTVMEAQPMSMERVTAAGAHYHRGFFTRYSGYKWVTPTKRVTKGEFDFNVGMPLAPPEVEMRVLGDDPIELDPRVYPHDGPITESGPIRMKDQVSFDGVHRLAAVDVAYGRAEDLAGKDLRGKLALLTLDWRHNEERWLDTSLIQPIRDAGAAGILVTNTHANYVFPIFVGPPADDPVPVGIPVVSLIPQEMEALRQRLAKGPVTIEVKGTPQEKAQYAYAFSAFENGRIPDDLDYDLTDGKVAKVDMRVHAARPTTFYPAVFPFKPRYWDGYALQMNQVKAPGTHRLYIGPLYPDVVYHRTLGATREGTGAGGIDMESETAVKLFTRPGRTAERWNAGPSAPGVAVASDAVYRLPWKEEEGWQEGDVGAAANQLTGRGYPVHSCQICRRDDNLLFPFLSQVRSDNHYTGPHNSRFGIDSVRLWSEGKELPFDDDHVYTLPEKRATYTMSVEEGDTSATWTFTSEPVTADNTQRGHRCGGHDCRVEPLVFVRYDLGDTVAMDNTVAAGPVHAFKVIAYHAPSSKPMPDIRDVRLWTSTDGGATWKRVPLVAGRDGAYTALAHYPRGATSVSLKVEAKDTAGNVVRQVSKHAFQLRSR